VGESHKKYAIQIVALQMPDFIESDFKDLKNYLLKKSLVNNVWINENEKTLWKMHRIIYSFIIWDYHLPHDGSGRIFISELVSDSIQTIVLCLNGYTKSVALLLRGIIENILRYIYYYDHPIEFTWLESGHFLQIDALINYTKKHPKFNEIPRMLDVLSEIKGQHKTISRYVHAQAVEHMQLTKSIEEINFKHDFFEWYINQLISLGSNVNLILSIFNREEFDNFIKNYQSLIVRRIEANDRKIVWES
jgi:hypothetical protein